MLGDVLQQTANISKEPKQTELKAAYEERVATVAEQQRRQRKWRIPKCHRHYPTTTRGTTASGSIQSETRLCSNSASTGNSNSFNYCIFNFGAGFTPFSRRVMLLLLLPLLLPLLHLAYVATTQTWSAPRTPGARNLDHVGVTPRRCYCRCYHGVVEFK